MLGRSWKTTLFGIFALLGVVAKVGGELSNGQPVDTLGALTAVAAGVGLILGKDHNVAGTSK
jgi:hypothetical protein